MTGITQQQEFFLFIEKKYDNLLSIAFSLTHNNDMGHELLHHTLQEIMEKKIRKEALEEFRGNLFFYTYVALLNQWNSSTSTFYNKYRKKNKEEFVENDFAIEDEEYDNKENKQLDLCVKIVNESPELDWYDRQIWMMYYFPHSHLKESELKKNKNKKEKQMSFRYLQDITKINYVSLKKVIDKVNDVIKEAIKNKK